MRECEDISASKQKYVYGYTAGGSDPQPDKDQNARPGLAGILHTMHPA